MRVVILLTVVVSTVLGLPTTVEKKYAQYSDDFARYAMYPLAMTAYEDTQAACTSTAINGTVRRMVQVKCDIDKDDSCAGFTAISHSMKAIVLTFRGTSNSGQLILEIVESITGFEKMPGGGSVARYFHDAFMAVWNGGMKDDFLTLRSQNPGYDVWFTGHSLGGSMAAIAADYLSTTYDLDMTKVRLVTFGEPRTGDQAYADAHDAKFQYSFRVVHNRDIVPSIPFPFMGFRHHRVEVWYPNNMAVGSTFKVCTGQEDSDCSEGQVDLWEPDHGTYFNIQDSDKWVANSCKQM